MDEKLYENIGKLHKYIYDKNTDAYNKLQSIYEHLAKRFIYENKKIFNINIDKKRTKELLETICKKYSYNRQDELIQSFYKINVYGNIGIKHYDESDFDDTQETNKAIFDINIIRNALIEFKKLYKFLYPNTEDYYRIDSLLLQCNTPNRYKATSNENNNIDIQNEPKEQLEIEKRKAIKEKNEFDNELNTVQEQHFNDLNKTQTAMQKLENELNQERQKNNIQKEHETLYSNIEHDEKQKLQEHTINVGTGNNDYGFKVKNIDETKKCNHISAQIYATIFNFLQRSKIIEKDIFIEEYEKNNNTVVDYRIVYRFEMAILLLIRNNKYDNNSLNIYSHHNKKELNCAIYHIDKHYEKIKQLIGNKSYTQINIKNTNKNAYIIYILKDDSLNDAMQKQKNEHKENIFIIDNDKSKMKANNNIWFEKNIIYSINEKKDKSTLEQYLNIFFGFISFKKGQLESIIDILNENKDRIIIMPTGSGKSLIYHFVAMLQPSPSLIISPTDILIKDQIRNLHELKHKIDDVKGYYQNDKNNELILDNKLVYVTPRILQQLNCIHDFIDLNIEHKIANIFLDEIHTISNWSHNFRPDYLMLSFNLNKFLDYTRWIGFTATANYRVRKDLSLQLHIPLEQIRIPIDLKKENITFQFKKYEKDKDYINSINQIGNSVIQEPLEKMLIFTKSQNTNNEISEQIDIINKKLNYDIDIFHESDEHSYEGFVNGRKCILLVESEMGIGINIPSVNKILHYGIPTSKSQFVQEIGRAGREGQPSTSIITYVPKKHMTNSDLKLLNLNTSVDEILDIISTNTSDISLSLKKIIGNLKHYTIMASNIRNLYQEIIKFSHSTSISIKCAKKDKENNTIDEYSMYFLVKMGIILNWYIKNITDDTIEYNIEICEDLSLSTIKKKTIEYINTFGNSKETCYNIEKSIKVEEIIYFLQTWYYNEFILIHRENLSNMLDFIEKSQTNNYSQEKIVNELSQYFLANASNIEDDALKYLQLLKITNDEQFNESNKFFKILSEIPTNNNSTEKMIQMEKYLEIKYDVIADLYIYVYNLLIDNINNISRFERVLINLPNEDSKQFLHFTSSLYKGIKNNEEKLLFHNILNKYYKIEDIITTIYKSNNKDALYYNLIMKYINKKMKGIVYNE